MDFLETFKSLLWWYDIQDEIYVLFNQFRFVMIVTHIYNIIPLISFGFVEYDEDVAPPLLYYIYIYIYIIYIYIPIYIYTNIYTNYHRDTHKVIHIFS